MTSPATISALASHLRVRHPDLSATLDDIAHPADKPCPPACTRCHLRHRGPCPCPICHTTHRRECPTSDRPRPGCLTCQLSDDLARAEALADLGDGIRSPGTEGGGHTKGSHSSPTETAALDQTRSRRDAAALAQSADDLHEAAAWLRTAGKATEPRDVARRLGYVSRALQDALSALHPLLPHAGAHRGAGHGEDECLAHRKAGEHEPSGPVKGACRWCYDFQREWGRMPPPELVRHHDARHHVTDDMIRRALARKKPQAKPTNPRRPASRRQRMLVRVKEAALRIGGHT